MNIEIVGALVSGVVSVVGVLIGGVLTYKLSHRSEKLLIRKKIRIEKIQETQDGLYTISKQLGTLLVNLKKSECKSISKEELRNISDEVQENCGSIIRNIRVNEVFLGESISLINDLIDQTTVFNNLIYDAYLYPDSPSKRNYHLDELSYENIESLIMETIDFAMKIKNRLDRELEKELK